jgi:hypothetical protein
MVGMVESFFGQQLCSARVVAHQLRTASVLAPLKSRRVLPEAAQTAAKPTFTSTEHWYTVNTMTFFKDCVPSIETQLLTGGGYEDVDG